MIWGENVPRQNWLLGRVVELLPSRDGHTRGAKVLIGKTRSIVDRPINMLYPIEFAVEKEMHVRNNPYSNTVEIVAPTTPSDDVNDGAPTTLSDVNDDADDELPRPRRAAAIAARKSLKEMS